MTVPYMKKVADANVITFIKLLFCWRGSVWKSIYFEISVYMILYYSIALIYNVFLASDENGEVFAVAVKFFNDLVPITFTTVTFSMGFYVTQIYSRWWSVFMMLPWPDALTFEICAYYRDRPGKKSDDEHARKTMARHLCLSFVLVFRDISERIKRRFPTLGHLVGSLLTVNEKNYLEREPVEERRYWIPIEWIALLLKKAYHNRQIDDMHYAKMVTSLMDYRERLHNVMQYDTVNLPLVYTQVVHLVTYAYFGIHLMASQKIRHPEQYWFEALPLPGYALFEFTFLVGWLKTGEVMLNPFGMDDDDLDVDILIERNFLVSSSAFVNLFEKAPEMVDIDFQVPLPTGHTESLIEISNRPKNVLQGSAVDVEIPQAQQAQITMIQNIEKKVKFISKEPPKEQPESLQIVTDTIPALVLTTGQNTKVGPIISPIHVAEKWSKKDVAKLIKGNMKEKALSDALKRKIRSNDTSWDRKSMRAPNPSRVDELFRSKRNQPVDARRVTEELEKVRLVNKVLERRHLMMAGREVDETQREQENGMECQEEEKKDYVTPMGSMVSKPTSKKADHSILTTQESVKTPQVVLQPTQRSVVTVVEKGEM